ncbi:hypothetical protein [Sphaerisporangium krabiense]|uniref:Uncharacterized protein n=1 Tax=Sphaerisporangium krabiense TaxID=763782 RepID=A0A7W9DQG7_9ACTN|nr:hypothetical protein [Sphaerisporangium krabiense]MBB5627471.1 hypothetical protein [Sphaerisporangium krabiense]
MSFLMGSLVLAACDGGSPVAGTTPTRPASSASAAPALSASTLLIDPHVYRDREVRVGVGFAGRLSVSPLGCVAIGESVVVAPKRSALLSGGTRVRLAGVGTFAIGESIDTGGWFIKHPKAGDDRLPDNFASCGKGSFIVIEP